MRVVADRSRPGVNEDEEDLSLSSWPSRGLTWWQVMLMTVLVVVVTVLLVKCLMEMYYHGWVWSKATCYLCIEKVDRRAWSSGKHRQECILRQELSISSCNIDLRNLFHSSSHPKIAVCRLSETIEEFPTHPTLRCSQCKEQLRLWPRGRGPYFRCGGICGGRKIQNNGSNRYGSLQCSAN